MADVAAGVVASALAPLNTRVRDRIVRTYREYYNEDHVRDSVLDVLGQMQEDTKTLRQVDFKTACDLFQVWQEQPMEYVATPSSIKDLEFIKFHASRAIHTVSDSMDKLIAIGMLIHATYHYTILTAPTSAVEGVADTETIHNNNTNNEEQEQNDALPPSHPPSSWLEAKRRAQHLLRHYLENFKALETAANEETMSVFLRMSQHAVSMMMFRDNVKRRKLLIQVLRLGHSVYILPPNNNNESHPRFPKLEEAAKKVARNRHVLLWTPTALPVLDEPYCYGSLEHHGKEISCCCAVLDKKDGLTQQHAISGSRDTTLKVWDLATGQCVRTLTGHAGPVSCCAVFDEGRRLVSGGSSDGDRTLKVWDLTDGGSSGAGAGGSSSSCTPCCTLAGHDHGVTCCAIFDVTGGQQPLLLSGSYLVLKVWDLGTGQCLRTLKGPTGWVWCCTAVVYLDEGGGNVVVVVVGCSDGTLQICDLDTGRCTLTLFGHAGDVWCCSSTILEEDEERRQVVVSGSGDKTLKVWDLCTGRCLRTLHGHESSVKCCTTFPDEGGRQLVLSGSNDKTLKLWDLGTAECIHTLDTGRHHAISCCSLFNDGRQLITGSSTDKTLKLWDLVGIR